jgi:DNA-binding response OmpR family regulator
MRVAILEDDAAQSAQLELILRRHGHVCTTVSTTKGMISLLRRSTFDLLLLDWTLPDGSGLEVVEWVRKTISPPPPMLMVTARADEADVISALKAGADDYVIKPLAEALLGARVEALLRRSYRDLPDEGVETYADYVFDTMRKTVALGAKTLSLTAKEFELALLLFRHANRALSRSYIADSVWGWNADLESRTLDIHVSRVRAKLVLRAENQVRLAPIYGYGYRLELSATPKPGDME